MASKLETPVLIQTTLFPDTEAEVSYKEPTDRTSTFVDNMRLPVHRWYRYSAGFSSEWVKEVVREFKNGNQINLFDPFAGSGTTVLAGEECGVQSYGIESHPFVVRIAKAKLLWYGDPNEFIDFAMHVLNYAKTLKEPIDPYPTLVYKCYSKESLSELDKIKKSWVYHNDNSVYSELTWLALIGILRLTSTAGTAPCQYVLPRKEKKVNIRPYEAFITQIDMMFKDMNYFRRHVKRPMGIIFQDDARLCSTIKDDSIDLIVTSPPYTNNYDYADATRFELSFLGEIKGWGDLQDKIRSHLIRSCSQHMISKNDDLTGILRNNNLKPIIDELSSVCEELRKERLLHGGKKNYHLMVAAYFSDLAKTFIALRRVCRENANVCFVIGDSAPYGIYVPVDKWLGELAVAAGFRSYYFEKTRDRNIKWKNRKHKIPLHEGRLWIKG